MLSVLRCSSCKTYRGNILISKELIKEKGREYIKRERECNECGYLFFTRELHLDVDKPKLPKRKKKL